MKLLFSGWSRHVLVHKPIDHDISKIRPSELDQVGGNNLARIETGGTTERLDLGEVDIVASADDVSLNGNYQVTVRLTKDEIANLAMIAFGNDPFAHVVDGLSKKRATIGEALPVHNSQLA